MWTRNDKKNELVPFRNAKNDILEESMTHYKQRIAYRNPPRLFPGLTRSVMEADGFSSLYAALALVSPAL